MAQSHPHKTTPSSFEVLQSQRYLWMARAFAMISVLAVIADVLLFVAIGSLQPLTRVQPFYLNLQDKDQQVINVVRPPFEVLNSEVLQESLVRQYILARFGMGADVGEIERRWGLDGPINWMSETSVFNEFLDKEATPLLDRARQEGLTRDVRILVVNKLRDDGNGFRVWQAEVELADVMQGSERPKIIKLVVTLEVGFSAARKGMQWNQRLKNPLGFIVTRFGRKEG